MFDVTSSKLLILGVVALLVIGPKDLPALLRTIGRYVGMIKRQAAEFRAQFEEAIRESELEQLKKEVETLGSATEEHMRSAERSLETELGTLGGSGAQADGAIATASASAEERTAAEQVDPGQVDPGHGEAGHGDPGAPGVAPPTAAAADPPPHAPDEPHAQPAPSALGAEAAAVDAPLRTPEKSGV